MAEGVIAVMLDQLAAELSRSVVVNDPAMQLIYASPHYGDEDPIRVRALLNHGAEPRARGHVLAQGVLQWTGPGEIPAEQSIGMHARICWPVRFEGELLGLLIVLDADGTLTTGESRRVAEVSRDLAYALHHEDRSPGSFDADEGTVLDLVSSDQSVRRSAIAAFGRVQDFASVTVVRMAAVPELPTTRPHREIALRNALSRWSGPQGAAMASAVDGGTATVLFGGRSAAATDVGASVAAVLARAEELADGQFSCIAGIGSVGAGLDHAIRSHTQAVVALRAAACGLAAPVAQWSSLGVHGPLLAMPSESLTESVVPDELVRLRSVDRDGLLADTVRAYLGAAGNGPAAAEQLHIHRTTLYYRLGRLAELTGLDLADGGTRAALQLGLAMHDVMSTRAPS